MPPLRPGMVGDDVTSLQLALIAVGLVAGQPTGGYDATTQKAVMELQRRAGLAQTGVMDDASWNALYQLQASVAPASDGGTVSTPRKPGTIQGDTTNIVGSGNGGAILLALLVGAATYWAHKKSHAYSDDDDGDEDEGDEEDDGEDIDFIPPRQRRAQLDDAVTDSLIDEPAVVSQSGRAGDCKKAAMLLLRRQGLVQRPNEKTLYDRVVRKVASNCRGEEGAIEEAIEEEQDRRDEAEAEVGSKLIRDARDTAKMPEHGFRKTKFKLTRKSTTEGRQEGVRKAGRRGSSAIEVRRGGKKIHSLRKEKAKTKRGYTWRKETE